MPRKGRHERTGAFVYECPRCSGDINPGGERVEDTDSLYVVDTEKSNEFEDDIFVAYRHTDETKVVRDALVDNEGLNVGQANAKIVDEDSDEVEGISKEDLLIEENVDPNTVKFDPDVASVESKTVTVKDKERLIICSDCKKESDEVIW